MLKTILILFLLIGLKAECQDILLPDTLYPVLVPSNRITRTGTLYLSGKLDSLTTGYATRLVDSTVNIKTDTVRVIMLVCDTSTEIVQRTTVDTFGVMRLLPVSIYNQNVYWQFGYKVITYWRNITYLDDKKRPLLKSIIVWNVFTEK